MTGGSSLSPTFSLLKKFFINLFDMQCLLDPTSYIVADNQTCKLIAVHQHNPLLKCSAVSFAAAEKVDVVTKRPLVAL